jgi:hypothetical protein
MARIAMVLLGEGDGLVLHGVVQLCRFGFQVGGNEPVGASLGLGGATRDPELHGEEGQGGQAEEKDDEGREVIAKDGEVGADA